MAKPNELQSVFDLPPVSFIEDDTLEAMTQRMIANYEQKYQEVTGQTKSLAPADPIRILIYAIALDLYQAEQYVDRAGKQDLLKYSYGEFLDNLAGNRGVIRQQPSPATTTLRFSLSGAKEYTVGIPAGTRVTNGNGVYFATSEYGEIPAGKLATEIPATCTEKGLEGNGFMAGQINVLVDKVAYIDKVENTATTGGGHDLESDTSLAERTFLAPSRYSVAGPEDAYIYWVKTYNTDIGSIKPVSPEPCQVVIYILMEDGSIPSHGTISSLQAFLQDENIRPLTDQVTVKAPTIRNFQVDLEYHINQSDAANAATIQQEVTAAVDAYIKWQTTQIGRDINPSELIRRVMAAGAKRVTVTAPTFTTVTSIDVPQCTGKQIRYGGLEDD